MALVDEMALAFILLIRAGAGLRIIYCFISIASDEEQAVTYKKRIKHTLVFYILAESVYIIRDIVLFYYT